MLFLLKMVPLLTLTCYLFWRTCVAAPLQESPESPESPEITTQNTTEITTENYDKTDLPQNLIDSALFHDYGKYTPQTFDYQNAQNARFPQQYDYNDTCIESYMRCLLNHDRTEGACAINEQKKIIDQMDVELEITKHVWNAHSYCDIFFDNCRRGYRVWRIINWNGKCVLNKTSMIFSPWKYYAEIAWP